MFIILDIIRPPEKIRRRRRIIKEINTSAPKMHRTGGGLPFYSAQICEEKSGINWEAVTKKCGRCASKIIAPRTVYIPDSAPFRRYVPKAFGSALIFNTAIGLLEAAKADPQKFILTVCDRNAVLSGRICELLPFSSVVRVITSHPERYAAACCRAYDEFGAALVLRSTYEPYGKTELIIAADGCFSPLMSKSAVIAGKSFSAGALRIVCSGIELTEEHSALLPNGTEAYDFAGALTELCFCRDYIRSVFSKTEIHGEFSSFKTPAEALLAYIGCASFT